MTHLIVNPVQHEPFGSRLNVEMHVIDSKSEDLGSALSESGRTLSINSGRAVAGGILLLLIFVAVFWDFWKAQFLYAYTFPSDWGHTLLIPFISGWMIWSRRQQLIDAQPFKPSWFGLPLITFGLLFYLLALVGPSWFALHHNARALGVAITIFGMAIQLFGWKAMKELWFPLTYLVIFFQTYTDRILRTTTETLQDLSAKGGFVMIRMMDIEADISGNVITVFPTPSTPAYLNIAEACSGMRMLVAFLALGVAIAWTGLDSWFQRILMIVLAVPVAVFVNMLRVASLGFLSLFDPELATGEIHEFVGFLWLLPAFMGYMGIMWAIRNMFIEVPSKDGELNAGGQA
jgi:exosortase